MSRSITDSESLGQLGDSDSELLERIRARDESALALLFKRHSRLVYSVAVKVLRDSHLAEDLLQDVFMQLWQRPLESFRVGGSLPALLAVTTRNRCIDHIRRKKDTVAIDDIQLRSPFHFVEASESQLLIERVRKEMQDLPTEQKQVLEMAFFDGLTHAEIATHTGFPLGTIKTRIRAAIQKLTKGVAK